MKYTGINGYDAVMIKPESLEEAALMLWISKRFNNKALLMEFDTTSLNGDPEELRLWITPIKKDYRNE